ncbi:hypothetical protein EC844_1126 [Acinetobacter calcoaceticus]|uniref:Uncharacterized protein n=1 Tax=Acinetobacter calcoaceticus TaxID=471 RepID=A0A4R1XQN4_ACICA|nr:hypothetical protein EC844_1126 [Acinetobacter calcoaceticus]
MTTDKQNTVRILKPQRQKIPLRLIDLLIGFAVGVFLTSLIFLIYSWFSGANSSASPARATTTQTESSQDPAMLTQRLPADRAINQTEALPLPHQQTAQVEPPKVAHHNPNPVDANDLSLLFKPQDQASKPSLNTNPFGHVAQGNTATSIPISHPAEFSHHNQPNQHLQLNSSVSQTKQNSKIVPAKTAEKVPSQLPNKTTDQKIKAAATDKAQIKTGDQKPNKATDPSSSSLDAPNATQSEITLPATTSISVTHSKPEQ